MFEWVIVEPYAHVIIIPNVKWIWVGLQAWSFNRIIDMIWYDIYDMYNFAKQIVSTDTAHTIDKTPIDTSPIK